MREVKIQAWDEKNKKMWQCGEEGEAVGEWTFTTFFDTETKEFVALIHGESFEVTDDPYPMYDVEKIYLPTRQYTGLKDKNGKEIYEGDILIHRTYVHSNTFRRGIVCFDEKHCTYKFVPHEAYESNAGSGGWSGFAFDYYICLEAEIIGNIYENAELLAEVTP